MEVLYLPSALVPAYNNQSFVDMVASNGGRNDVTVISTWAMAPDVMCDACAR